MSDRPTPETDVLRKSIDNGEDAEAHMTAFAHKLEQERDEAREKAERYRIERDVLVQKLDAWEEIAEHLHQLVQHPAYGVEQAIQRMDVLEAYKHLKDGH